MTAASIRRSAGASRSPESPISFHQEPEARAPRTGGREMREEVRSSSGAAAEPPLAVARSSSPLHTPVARYGGCRSSGPLLLAVDS